MNEDDTFRYLKKCSRDEIIKIFREWLFMFDHPNLAEYLLSLNTGWSAAEARLEFYKL